ncbi:hypothetical protein TNCV_3271831 [Trichonephila clavipes]|nr:hypothetical protein TNCV_3271831 [Trichonephila clavipes]
MRPFAENPLVKYSGLQPITYLEIPVRRCTILVPKEVIWFTHFLSIEEIAIVVEHQDRLNQLQLVLRNERLIHFPPTFYFSTRAPIGGEGGDLAYLSRACAHMPANKNVSVALSFDV